MYILCTVLDMDYHLLVTSMMFRAKDGDGTSLNFGVTVNSDNLIEWEKNIVIHLVEPRQSNIILNNSQVQTTLKDIDSKKSWNVR